MIDSSNLFMIWSFDCNGIVQGTQFDTSINIGKIYLTIYIKLFVSYNFL